MNSDYDITRKAPDIRSKPKGVKRDRKSETSLADKSLKIKPPSAVKKYRAAEDVAHDVLAARDTESTDNLFIKSMQGRVSRKRERMQELSVEEIYDWLKRVKPTSKNIPELIENVRNLLVEHRALLKPPLDEMKKILDRFDQLEHADIEKKSLTPGERLQLAVNIEETIPRVIQLAEKTFVEKSKTVPRELLFKKKGSVAVMADPKNSKLKARGTFKKVFSAVVVPLERDQVLSKAVQARIDITEPSEVAVNKEEIAFFKMVKNQPGFVKMHSYFQIGKDEISQFCVIFEAYDGTLTELTQRDLTFDQKIDIARQFLEAMAFFHANKAFHLDLKMDNVLFKMDPSGKITIGITDFGHSLRKDPHKACDLSAHLLSNGEYGTKFASAPELIGNKKIADKGNALEEIDNWAVGMFLHELFYGDPSWTKILNIDEALTAEMQNQVKELVIRDVEVPLKKLLKKQRPTQDEQIQIAIFQLLRVDPKNRWTVSQALRAINQALEVGRK